MINDQLKTILLDLQIGNDTFFHFMEGKVKSYPLGVQDFPWGCFPLLNQENKLMDIRMIVPNPVDIGTIRVNIHEYTHAFEMYQGLGNLYVQDTEKSEALARSKEKEYVKGIKKISW